MTAADNLEITNLVNNIKSMSILANKGNETYVDTKVISFCENTIKDYMDTKKFIIDLVNENPSLYLNLNEVYDGDYNCSSRGRITIKFGDILFYCKVTAFENIRYNYVKINSLEVYDVMFQTSNTTRKDYTISSASDLVDSHAKALDCLNDPRTTSEWYKIYGLATWSREKCKKLVEEFKKELHNRSAMYHTVANTYEDTKRHLENISEYEKVGF